MLPLTPPAEPTVSLLNTTSKFLNAQAKAVQSIATSFDEDDEIRRQFHDSLTILHNCVQQSGKIIITGMGKSFKIGEKLVATLHSFGIYASALHPTDALHGDMGIIRPQDVMIMITASGNTPELKLLYEKLHLAIPVLCLTCTLTSPLAELATSLIPAPVPAELMEINVYGLAAPTITTTVTLVVGDAMCITLYEQLEHDLLRRQHNFGRFHPGGTIGLSYSKNFGLSRPVHSWDQIHELPAPLKQCEELDLWRACAHSEFLRYGDSLYRSKDIIGSLKSGSTKHCIARLISAAPKLEYREARQSKGFCIVVNSNLQPLGVCDD